MKRFLGILLSMILVCCAGSALPESAARPDLPEAKIRPLPPDPAALDFRNGSFCMKPEDVDKIAAENWFTAALYLEDLYDEKEILAMAPGDTVLVNGHVFTVAKVVEHGEEGDGKAILEIYTDEPFGEEVYTTIAFHRWYAGGEPSGRYVAEVDDWVPVTRVSAVRVDLPLSESFVYYYIPGGDDPVPYTREKFLENLNDSWSLSFMNPYNTSCRLQEGRLAEVSHSSYPEGPEEE